MHALTAVSNLDVSPQFFHAQVAALGAKLEKSENEVKRRRRDAKEHAEQMKVQRRSAGNRSQ